MYFLYRLNSKKSFMCPLTSVLQELQVEKQKTGRAEVMIREQRAVMEKELGSMQGKAQGSYQELQSMQIKVSNFVLITGQLLHYIRRHSPLSILWGRCEGTRTCMPFFSRLKPLVRV